MNKNQIIVTSLILGFLLSTGGWVLHRNKLRKTWDLTKEERDKVLQPYKWTMYIGIILLLIGFILLMINTIKQLR